MPEQNQPGDFRDMRAELVVSVRRIADAIEMQADRNERYKRDKCESIAYEVLTAMLEAEDTPSHLSGGVRHEGSQSWSFVLEPSQ